MAVLKFYTMPLLLGSTQFQWNGYRHADFLKNSRNCQALDCTAHGQGDGCICVDTWQLFRGRVSRKSGRKES